MKRSRSRKYQALFSDVDGTIIPYDYSALPSAKVSKSINNVQDLVFICLVSGRSFTSMKHILDKIKMSKGYAITNNGANVIDISSGKVLYDKPILKKDLITIINTLHEEQIPFYLKENHNDMGLLRGYYTSKIPPISAYMIFTNDDMGLKRIDSVIKKLSIISTISIHKSQHKFPNKYGINITNNEATKLHGISIVKKMLNLSTENIIGIGDGYNDFPLLLACGLKVAMGNAVPELKEIADYIAPSVEEDGVSDVIERFILNEK